VRRTHLFRWICANSHYLLRAALARRLPESRRAAARAMPASTSTRASMGASHPHPILVPVPISIASLPRFLSLPALTPPLPSLRRVHIDPACYSACAARVDSRAAFLVSVLLPYIPPHLSLPSSRTDTQLLPPYSLLMRRRQAAHDDAEAASIFLPRLPTRGWNSRARACETMPGAALCTRSAHHLRTSHIPIPRYLY
jgi:hypothetical protein